nr:unnamed protein product [Spirometra erinaceieuropaei]
MSLFASGCVNFELTINTNKTAVRRLLSPHVEYNAPRIIADDKQLKTVDIFAYVGSTLSRNINIDDKMAHRISKKTPTRPRRRPPPPSPLITLLMFYGCRLSPPRTISATTSATATKTTTSPTPAANGNTHFGPSTTTFTTASNVHSISTCPHYNRIFTSGIGLVRHLRINCKETGEPVLEAPTYTRYTCPHCQYYLPHRPVRSHVTTKCLSISAAITSNLSTATDSAGPDLACPHCHRTCTARIGLVGNFGAYRTETGKSVPPAPKNTRRHRLNSSYFPLTCDHRMGLLAHMRIHENLQ